MLVSLETQKWCKKHESDFKVNTQYYNDTLILKKLDIPKTIGLGQLSIVKQDCLDAAEQLLQHGKVCVLNMASYQNPGGGWLRGAQAQEEQLFRRTNLCLYLEEKYYPLPMMSAFYTSNVTVIRDRNYKWLPLKSQFHVDVLSEAAICKPHMQKHHNFVQITVEKIRAMFRLAEMYGARNLVLSAFGCGAYQNPPRLIATLFSQILKEELRFFDRVVFAILDNDGSNNYEVFINNIF